MLIPKTFLCFSHFGRKLLSFLQLNIQFIGYWLPLQNAPRIELTVPTSSVTIAFSHWVTESLEGLPLAVCFQNTAGVIPGNRPDQTTALQEPLCNGSLAIAEKTQSTYNAYRSLSHCYPWRSLGMHTLGPHPKPLTQNLWVWGQESMFQQARQSVQTPVHSTLGSWPDLSPTTILRIYSKSQPTCCQCSWFYSAAPGPDRGLACSSPSANFCEAMSERRQWLKGLDEERTGAKNQAPLCRPWLGLEAKLCKCPEETEMWQSLSSKGSGGLVARPGSASQLTSTLRASSLRGVPRGCHPSTLPLGSALMI